MEVIDTDPRFNSVVWLWQAQWDPLPVPCGTWTANGLSYHRLTSNGLDGSLPRSDEPDNTGHRGVAGLTFPIRCDEVRSGIINHVLKFVMPAPAQDVYWFPMVETDGTGTAKWAVPEGARLHIKYSADLSGLSGSALILAKALQRYGMLLGDSDSTDPAAPGTVQVGVEPSTMDGDPGCWQDLGLTSDALASIPWSDWEVLPANYGE